MMRTQSMQGFERIPWRLVGAAGLLLFAGLLAGWPAAPPVAAQGASSTPASGALPADLDLVPRTALGFSTVRVADLLNSDLLKGLLQELRKVEDSPLAELEKRLGMPLNNLERCTFVLWAPDPENALGMILSTAKPFQQAELLKTLLPGASPQKHGGKTYFLRTEGDVAVHFVSDRILVLARGDRMPAFLDQMARKNLQGPLGEALSLAAAQHTVVSALDPEPLANLVGEDLPFAVRPFLGLLKARLITAVLDLGKQVQANVHLRFAKEDEAREAEKALAAGLFLGRQLGSQAVEEMAKNTQGIENVVSLLRQGLAAVKDVAPQREGVGVRLAAAVPFDAALLGPAQAEAIARLHSAATRAHSSNNLKQIALAMHNYHDTYGRFPPAVVYSKDGRPLYSWRVLLLPFLQQDNLFKEFKKDEAWDSPHNKKLLARFPPVYAPVRGKTTEPYSTYYQVFVGQGSVFEGRNGRSMSEITDGTSNTLLVVEAGQPVPWSKPEDVAFEPDQPIAPLGGLFAEGFHTAFCDGSVRFIKRKIGLPVLRLLIMRGDGMVIDSKDF